MDDTWIHITHIAYDTMILLAHKRHDDNAVHVIALVVAVAWFVIHITIFVFISLLSNIQKTCLASKNCHVPRHHQLP